MLECVVALERAETKGLRIPLLNSLNETNSLLESKEQYIGNLLNERSSSGQLGRSFARLTKQRQQNHVSMSQVKLFSTQTQTTQVHFCSPKTERMTREGVFTMAHSYGNKLSNSQHQQKGIKATMTMHQTAPTTKICTVTHNEEAFYKLISNIYTELARLCVAVCHDHLSNDLLRTCLLMAVHQHQYLSNQLEIRMHMRIQSSSSTRAPRPSWGESCTKNHSLTFHDGHACD